MALRSGLGQANDVRRVYERLTSARVRVLREVADGYKVPEIAHRLGMTVNGVRSVIDDLRQRTGATDIAELGRWWRRCGPDFVAFIAAEAGVDLRLLPREPGPTSVVR